MTAHHTPLHPAPPLHPGTGRGPEASATSKPADSGLRRRGATTAVTLPLILLARLWQFGPSRLIPATCRYEPSCSAYAITAWTRYGALAGSWLALKRIVRCNPWGGCGHDPVP